MASRTPTTSADRASKARRDADRKVAQFELLSKEADYPAILTLLRRYVEVAIPSAARTAGDEWVITAMPSTNRSAVHQRLAAVSVSTPETLVLYRVDDGDSWSTRGIVFVQRKTLLAANKLGSLAALHDELLLFDDAPHPTMDGEAAVIFFALDEVDALYALPGWDAAARALVGKLMERGTSVQRRYHNPSLAEAALV